MVVELGHQANCSLQVSSFWHSRRLGFGITMYASKEVKIEVPTVQQLLFHGFQKKVLVDNLLDIPFLCAFVLSNDYFIVANSYQRLPFPS